MGHQHSHLPKFELPADESPVQTQLQVISARDGSHELAGSIPISRKRRNSNDSSSITRYIQFSGSFHLQGLSAHALNWTKEKEMHPTPPLSSRCCLRRGDPAGSISLPFTRCRCPRYIFRIQVRKTAAASIYRKARYVRRMPGTHVLHSRLVAAHVSHSPSSRTQSGQYHCTPLELRPIVAPQRLRDAFPTLFTIR